MKKWKAIAGVILVFVLGALAGAIVTHRICERRIESIVSGGPHAVREVILNRLNRELGLDASQREQIRAIFRETHEQIRAAHKQTQPMVEAIMSRAEDRVRAVLRPDQRIKFEKFVAERKAKRMKESQ